MKRLTVILAALLMVLFSGCSSKTEYTDIAATTLPVYTLTTAITEGTGLTVSRLISEPVSCLHDYSLNVGQVRTAEAADLIVISGAGLEDFMEDILSGKNVIDASDGISLLHEDSHDHEDERNHEDDPHIWLSPSNAMVMAKNITAGLSINYPEHEDQFSRNLDALLLRLTELKAYGETTLSTLACREMITFHDGFSYFADAFDLTILDAVEEESGSEASAKELIHLIQLTREHELPAVFTERNGSPSAAGVICAETGIQSFALDMAMAGDDYFEAMYSNINTVKEALG